MIEIDLARCGFSQAAVGSRYGRAVSGGLEKGISRIVAVTHYARWSQRSSGEQNGDSAGNFTARDLGAQLRLDSGIAACLQRRMVRRRAAVGSRNFTSQRTEALS